VDVDTKRGLGMLIMDDSADNDANGSSMKGMLWLVVLYAPFLLSVALPKRVPG
jgi:hypothetical protein